MNRENENRHNEMPRRDLQELIDCCRPGSDDAFEPELAELGQRLSTDAAVRRQYERSQQFDAAIARAFHDVPAPDGLADRLLATLQARQAGVAGMDSDSNSTADNSLDCATAETEPADSQATLSLEAATGRRGVSRRWLVRWMMTGAASAAALLMLGLVGYAVHHYLQPPSVTSDEVVEHALVWTSEVQNGAWQVDPSQAPVQSFPLEPSVRGLPMRWQQLRSVEGELILAYDLTPPGKSLVVQFTVPDVQRRQYQLPRSLSQHPTSSTGGFCIGVCHRNGVLYVLVVEGDTARYRQFVRPKLPVT